MKCVECQFDNRDGIKFCEECGTRMELVCSNCGTNIPSGRRYCGECGFNLSETERTTSIDYSQPRTYTPKFLADKILDMRGSIEGERKLVTVLFADIANYTSMSEKLDPEDVHYIMDGCFKVVMEKIHSFEGTIDKFLGDGIMALFGAPLAHEDHAHRACYAALAIQEGIDAYGRDIKQEYGVELIMRVGLNSGPVIVGAVGNDLRMDYTAIGDTTNLASRMQSLSQPGNVLVTRDTYRIVRDFFMFEPLGKARVKGKDKELEIYQLIEKGEIETRIEAAVAKGLTRFVGRQKEITILKDAFEKVRSGCGQVVGVVGEAGVGKSRLLLEMKKMLSDGESTYLEGRCLHYGCSMAYLPFLDILRSYFDVQEGERDFITEQKIEGKIKQLDENLKAILPPLRDILSFKVEDKEYIKMDPPLKRVRIFEAIRDLVIRKGQNNPLIIAIEDFHWIDKTSEEFTDYLIGSLANSHILMIILYRPEYTHQWGSRSYYSQISLDELSTSNSAEMVRSILAEAEIAPDLRDLILTRTTGNPLFVEEFTHALLENGSIQRKDHRYELSVEASNITVPDTIQGIISARMDRLDDNLKRTMQVASVIGRDFALRVLQNIIGKGEEIKSYLLYLQGLEFIHEKSLFPEMEYTFKHALMQEVAYNNLLLKKRREIHEKTGKAIEELYQDKLEEFYEVLAYHYSSSMNWEKAYHYLTLSGNKATQRYSLWEAFRFYKQAINILNDAPDVEENRKRQIEVRLLIASPVRFLAYPEDSFQILKEGEMFSREIGDERSLASFHSFIGLYYAVKGDPLKWSKYTENAFQEAIKVEDVDLAAPAAFSLCASYGMSGDYEKIADIVPGTLALIEKNNREFDSFGGGLNPYSHLLGHYGTSMAWLGNFCEAEELCEKSLRFAYNLDDLFARGFAEVMYGIYFVVKGDGLNSIEHCQKAIKYGEESQIDALQSIAYNGLAWGYYFLGDCKTAQKYFKHGIKIQNKAGYSFLISWLYLGLGMVRYDSGDMKGANNYIEEAIKLANDQNEKWVEGLATAALGRVLSKADVAQYIKAEECILQGIKVLNDLKIKPKVSEAYLYLGEHYNNVGQRKKALTNLKKAEGMFREMDMDYWLQRTEAVLESV